MATTGRIHSLESFGAVDGPGIRYVVFFQGCPLRCIYCHNPDTWPARGGREMTVEELVETILPYKLFLRRGGVTLTGGEPLAQSGFVHELIDALHTHGLHVAIDTAGSIPLDQCRPAVDAADMLLLDIKALDAGCAASSAAATAAAPRPCWNTARGAQARLAAPCGGAGLHADEKRLRELAAYLKPFTCIERVELLPFHQMGSYKWAAEKLPYALQDKRTPTQEEMENARKIFSDAGLKVQ